MKKLWALCLSGVCIAGALCAEQSPQEATDGRVRLYIKAADPNGGEKMQIRWRQVDGPAVKINDPQACERIIENGVVKFVSDTYFVANEPGKYKFEVSVENEEGEATKRIIERDVLAATPAPIAIAGKDKEVTVNQVVMVTGEARVFSAERKVAKWEWRLAKAPERFKPDAKLLKDLNEREFNFKVTEEGHYEFELRVHDGSRWSQPARMIVSAKKHKHPIIIEEDDKQPAVRIDVKQPDVSPQPNTLEVLPVVAAGKTIPLGDPIFLDGTASKVDPKTNPRFSWEEKTAPGDAPRLRTLKPDTSKPFNSARDDAHNYPIWIARPATAGEYTFVLHIQTDDGRQFHSDPVTYKIVALASLKAEIFVVKPEVRLGDMVELDGSPSKGAAKLEYRWGKVPGKMGPSAWEGEAGPKIRFRADEEGEYTVQLQVSDGREVSAPAYAIITVKAGNRPPTIVLDKTKECVTGEKLRIEAKVEDPENDRCEVKWTCIDPPGLEIPADLASNPVLVFIPKNAGCFTFKIVATDAHGRSAVAQTMVGVQEAGKKPPTAVIEGPRAVKVGGKARFSGAKSSSAPPGRPLSYRWSQIMTPEGPKIEGELPKPSEKVWEFVVSEPGEYVIGLLVLDGTEKSELEKFTLSAAKDNAPPTAKIVGPENGVLAVGLPLELDGSGSEDSDGDKLTYKWRVSGKAQVELSGQDQDRCTLKAKSLGTASVELIVNDGKQDSTPARIELRAEKANTKPEARITGPAVAKPGALIELTAAGSSDPDEDDEITAFIWAQPAEGGGPDTGLRRSELRKRELRFKVEKAGTYVLSLQVVDKHGEKSEPVTHKIEVKGVNKPPRATAALLTAPPFSVGKELKLSARGSVDPEGAPLTYRWQQLEGPALKLPDEMSEILNLAPGEAGDYVLELIVNDGENESPAERVAFSVKPANQAPVAVITPVAGCEPGGKIILDGSGSNDQEGDKLEYRWTRVSGPAEVSFGRNASRPKAEVTLARDGEYVFELKVFDGKEWSEPQRVKVKTSDANQAPVAAVAQAALVSEEGAETVLDASASSDPDQGPQPLKFTWRAVDSRVELHSEGAQARFTPRKSGEYRFQVKVSDGRQESAAAEVRVTVLKAGTLPVAVAHASPNPLKAAVRNGKNGPNTVLVLDGSHSQLGAAAKAAGRAELTYTWAQVGGDDLRLKAQDLLKAQIGMRIFSPGTYRFRLQVSDGTYTSVPSFIDVRVEQALGSEPRPSPAKSKTSAPENGQDNGGALLPPPRDAQALAGEVAYHNTLDALARDQQPEAEEKLLKALSSPEETVRTAAAAALTQRGINGIPALIQVLEKGNELARKQAHSALIELTREHFDAEAGQWKRWWALQPVAKSTQADL